MKLANPIFSSQRTNQEAPIKIKEVFEWTLKVKDLLRTLHDLLSKTVEAWKSFTSNGDLDYFLNEGSEGISRSSRLSLMCTSKVFTDLEALLKMIVSLKERISDYFVFVSLNIALFLLVAP